MKRPLFHYFALIVFSAPSIVLADWGRTPAFEELSRYSQVSLGFASQDLKSPISTFGHTFLIFHNSDPPEADSLTIQFTGEATDVPAHISALISSVPGSYSPEYLSELTRGYDYENRGLWLYKLSLSDNEIKLLKQNFLLDKNSKLPYDFTQKNCAFYIAQAISQSRGSLPFKREKIFVTPVDTLRWAHSENIISSEIFIPSTQLRALREYENLSDKDKKIIVAHLNLSISPKSDQSSKEINNAFSAIAEHMIPREADSSKRNYLYSVKRNFPALQNSSELKTEDPSRTLGPASISMHLLPQIYASVITISPGFIHINNEAASGQKNSTIEVARTDLFADTTGSVRLEQFHLIHIESNQPSGYLRDGFTQALDISYTDYRTYLNKQYNETKLLFGRGISWLYAGYTISTLPVVSAVIAQDASGYSNSGRIELRLNIYKQFSERITFATKVDYLITPNSEILRSVNFDLISAIQKDFSISLNLHQLTGAQQTTALAGLRLTKSF